MNLAAATLPAGVFRFTSPRYKSLEVTPFGDTNSDGRTDILISGRNAGGYAALHDPTVAWIFFGGVPINREVDLAAPGDIATALTIQTHDRTAFAGYRAISVGDVDRDNRPDLLIADPLAGGPGNPGAAYLVFSSALTAPGSVQLDQLQASGAAVLIKGAHRLQNI